MLKHFLCLLLLSFAIVSQACPAVIDSSIVVKRTEDFTVSGDGKAENWNAATWQNLSVQNSTGRIDKTRFKVMYSDQGMYFLFDCEDKRLTSTIMEDFGALFNEDVVEVFLWPDERHPIYLEYELSPLDYELAIIVPNIDGKFQGWRPWFYEKNKVQHATSATGPQKKSMAAVDGWKAEFFIPYKLMNPIVATPPVSGSKWRGNFYRIDYDGSSPVYYSWQKTAGSFHEYQKFGTLVFE